MLQAGATADKQHIHWTVRRHRKGGNTVLAGKSEHLRLFAWCSVNPDFLQGLKTGINYWSALVLMVSVLIFAMSNASQISAKVSTSGQ